MSRPAAPETSPSWAPSLGLVFPLLAYKLLLFFFIYLSLVALPDLFDRGTYAVNQVWPLSAPVTWLSRWGTWDAHHYMKIADIGYTPGDVSNAFWPLFPFLMRLLAPVLGGSLLAAGLVWANFFSLLGTVLFHRLVCEHQGRERADLAVLFLLAYPGSIYFSFVYTEALFFLLAVLFFLFLLRGSYHSAAIVSFFLPLTRSVGIFILPVFWVHLILHRAPWKAWLASLWTAAGFAAYMLIMRNAVGDPLAGFTAQSHFIMQPRFNRLFDAAGFVRLFFMKLQPFGMLDGAIDRACFLLYAACLAGVWKLNKTYFVYALLIGLFPAAVGGLMAYNRYLAVVFPIFIVMAGVLSPPGRKFWLCFFLAALFSCQMIFLLRFVNNHWVG